MIKEHTARDLSPSESVEHCFMVQDAVGPGKAPCALEESLFPAVAGWSVP